MARTHSVAVVGGGLAGLATATYLGRAGHAVTLFERSDSLGGRAATDIHEGYRHNRGPHALYRGGAAEAVLAELGVSYTGTSPSLSGVAYHRGRTYALPVNGRSMATTRLFGLRSRVEASRLLLSLRKVAPTDTRTISEWLDQESSQPTARAYVEAIVRLSCYANAPGHLLVSDVGRQFAGTGRGVLYVDGGWQTLVEGLRAAAETAGVEVVTSARVAEVTRAASERINGIRLVDGSTVEFDAVVLAATPDVAAALSGSPALAAVAESAVAARAACLDIRLSRLPNPRRPFALGIDAPYYLSTHSLYAKLAPEGRVLLSVAKYLPVEEPRDPGRDLAELEAFLDVAQPGWRPLEEGRQYLPNMVVTSTLPVRGSGGVAGRTSPAATGVPGLFVAGDWVGAEGWLTDATLSSARAAAEMATTYLASEVAPTLIGVS